MYMIWFVLNNPDRLDELLDAWEAVGIIGVTIFESTGIQRRRKQGEMIHMRYMLGQTVRHHEVGHYTLMSIVPSREVVDQCLQATEALIGDLTDHDTGVFAAWRLETSRGHSKRKETKEGG